MNDSMWRNRENIDKYYTREGVKIAKKIFEEITGNMEGIQAKVHALEESSECLKSSREMITFRFFLSITNEILRFYFEISEFAIYEKLKHQKREWPGSFRVVVRSLQDHRRGS